MDPVLLTQRDVMNFIARTIDAGGTVKRVLISWDIWWNFLLDVQNEGFVGPLEVRIWGVSCVPSRDVSFDEKMRAE